MCLCVCVLCLSRVFLWIIFRVCRQHTFWVLAYLEMSFFSPHTWIIVGLILFSFGGKDSLGILWYFFSLSSEFRNILRIKNFFLCIFYKIIQVIHEYVLGIQKYHQEFFNYFKIYASNTWMCSLSSKFKQYKKVKIPLTIRS